MTGRALECKVESIRSSWMRQGLEIWYRQAIQSPPTGVPSACGGAGGLKLEFGSCCLCFKWVDGGLWGQLGISGRQILHKGRIGAVAGVGVVGLKFEEDSFAVGPEPGSVGVIGSVA